MIVVCIIGEMVGVAVLVSFIAVAVVGVGRNSRICCYNSPAYVSVIALNVVMVVCLVTVACLFVKSYTQKPTC